MADPKQGLSTGYKSPYALQPASMETYKPSTDYSGLKGFDPYRNMSTTPTISKDYSGLSNWGDGMSASKYSVGTPNQNYGLLNTFQDRYKNMFSNNGGLGSYATVTDDYGNNVEVSQEAYNAIQNPYESDGTALDFSKANSGADFGQYAGLALNAMNAYNGYQQNQLAKQKLGLAREQFGFEKAATNRNLQNQASQYNTGLQNSGEVGMALAGNTMDANARAARQAQLDSQKLSTAVIG